MKSLILSALLTLSATPVLACETFTLGDLTIEHAWSRATIGADRPGVFYVEITNNGSTDDALIGIATPAAGMPMLHETVVTDGIAPMPAASPRCHMPCRSRFRLAKPSSWRPAAITGC